MWSSKSVAGSSEPVTGKSSPDICLVDGCLLQDSFIYIASLRSPSTEIVRTNLAPAEGRSRPSRTRASKDDEPRGSRTQRKSNPGATTHDYIRTADNPVIPRCQFQLRSFVRHLSQLAIFLTMLGRRLAYVLAGLGAPTWAVPVLPRDDTSSQSVPQGCIPEVWEQAHFCIIAPPTTTIGPSTKIRDTTHEALEARAADNATPVLEIKGTPTNGDCIPIVWNGVSICIAPPTTTIGPSTKRTEPEVLAERDTPSPTPTESQTCAIWNGVIICWAPPQTTIGADPSVPGGPLIPGPYVPGQPITPDPTIPGGEITPDPYVPGGEVTPST